LSKIIEPLRGVHDVLPAQGRGLAALWSESRGRYSRLRLRGIPRARDRTDAALQALDRRFHGYRREGNVQLRRSGRGSHHAAPEATAGIVRAVISNGMLREGAAGVVHGTDVPARAAAGGRYRQFHQIDAEAFGFEGPDVDAEIILVRAPAAAPGACRAPSCWSIPWERPCRARRIGASSRPTLALMRLARRGQQAAPAGQSAAHTRQQESGHAALVAGAPLLLDSLDAESRAHFEALCEHLRSAGIEYHIEPHLVRGLDYYTRTVFEWTTDALGSQSTVCAGGRYDGLVAQLGGPKYPGIGWAMGQERIVMLLEKQGLTSGATGRRFTWCWPGNAEMAGLSNWRSNCGMPGRISPCRSISAAGASKRSSSARTRAARVCDSYWGMTKWPGAWSASRLASGIGAGRMPLANKSVNA
jgi:histidyl-tRNA synthetase